MSNINSQFFNGLYQDVWRELIPNGLTEAEVDFIEDIASLDSNEPVLDFMCGYGRHALELSRRNIQITAIDNLPAYISEIQEQSLREGLPVEALVGEIETMELSGTYKAAICMGNSFAFFDKKAAIELLKKIANVLLPGGTLIINSWMIAEIAFRHFQAQEWYYAGPYKCIIENKYLQFPSRIEFEQTTISPDNQIELRKGVDYIFSLDELSQMLVAAGLFMDAVYSTPRKRPFNLGDTRAYIVARKIS